MKVVSGQCMLDRSKESGSLSKIPLCGGQREKSLPLSILYAESWSDGALEYWKKRHSELLSCGQRKTVSSINTIYLEVFVYCFYNTPWPRPTTKIRALYQHILIND